MERSAIFKLDHNYKEHRMQLYRLWDGSKPMVMFVGLNPSTANGTTDDPTIRRVIAISQQLGYGAVYMMNLFTFVSTDPKRLVADEFWMENLNNIKEIIEYKVKESDVIFAWGNFSEAAESGIMTEEEKPYWNAYPKPVKKEKPTKEIKKGYKPKIKAVSKKRAVQQREYSHLAKQYKIDNPVCQIPVEGCTRIATELHHAAGRCGGLLTDVAYFKSACHNCHSWTTTHPKESIEKGYSFSRLSK